MRRCSGSRTIISETLSSNHNEKHEEQKEQICKQDQQQVQSSFISALEPCIIIDILARLPVRTVLNCRCVCKPWLSLISDPYFRKIYLTKPPTTCIVLSVDSAFYFLELGQDYEYTNSHTDVPKRFNMHFSLPIESLELVGSCNGLLCFSHYYSRKSAFYISNPILGEYTALPVPKIDHQTVRVSFGIGFSTESGHYKVLRVLLKQIPRFPFPRSLMKSEGEVCTLGTKIWRSIGEIPFPLFGKLGDANLNGFLHYIVDDFHKPEYLYSFDIEKEQVQPIPPPPAHGHSTIWMSLGVLGNCLCIFDNSWYRHLDIWSMKDYGVAESWTKDYILKTSIPFALHNSWLRPVTVWKNGEILISSRSGVLVSYNPIEKRFTKTAVFGSQSVAEAVGACHVPAVAFDPNFCSLRDVIGDF